MICDLIEGLWYSEGSTEPRGFKMRDDMLHRGTNQYSSSFHKHKSEINYHVLAKPEKR